MTQRFLALSSGVVALFSIAVFPAFAATVTGSTAANAATNVGSAVTSVVNGTSGSGSATASTGVTTGTSNSSTGVGVTVSGTGTDSTGANTSGSATVNLNGSVNTSGPSQMTTGTLNLANSDAAVMNYNNSGTTVTDPAQVTSSNDLNTYADATMHSDSDIQNVQLSNTAVAMTYDEPGKLFGFIPVSISAKAAVDASGNVSITYPWYHFLISTNDVNLKSDLQTRIQSTMNNDATTSASASADAGFSARMQAEIMADLEGGFNSMVNGSSTASAQGTSSAAMNASSTQ